MEHLIQQCTVSISELETQTNGFQSTARALIQYVRLAKIELEDHGHTVQLKFKPGIDQLALSQCDLKRFMKLYRSLVIWTHLEHQIIVRFKPSHPVTRLCSK